MDDDFVVEWEDEEEEEEEEMEEEIEGEEEEERRLYEEDKKVMEQNLEKDKDFVAVFEEDNWCRWTLLAPKSLIPFKFGS